VKVTLLYFTSEEKALEQKVARQKMSAINLDPSLISSETFGKLKKLQFYNPTKGRMLEQLRDAIKGFLFDEECR